MPEMALFNDFSVFQKTPPGVYEINDMVWALRTSSNSNNVYNALGIFLTDEEGEQWEEWVFASSLVSKATPSKPAQLLMCPSEDGKTPVMGLSEEALMKLGTGKAAFGEGEEEQCRGEYFIKFNKKAAPGGNAGKIAQALINLLGDAYDQNNASTRYFNGMKFLWDRQPDKKNSEYDTFLPTTLIENPNSGGKKSSSKPASTTKANGSDSSSDDDVNSAIADGEIAALATEEPKTITRMIPDLTRGKDADERAAILKFVKDGAWLASPDRSFAYDPKTKSVTARA